MDSRNCTLVTLSLLLLLTKTICVEQADCQWPQTDVLFVVDSTVHVGEANFTYVQQFVLSIIEHDMEISSEQVRVAFTLYTPKAVHVFNFITGTDRQRVKRGIQRIKFSPCLGDGEQCRPLASVNSIARTELELQSGNRQKVPDVVLVISSSTDRIPEIRINEVLLKPLGPIHVFYIVVGELDQMVSAAEKYTASATTIKFSAINFTSLSRLVHPLCRSANYFTKRGAVDEVSFGGLTAIIVIVVLVLIFFIVGLLLLYSIYSYRKQNAVLRKNLSTIQNDYKLLVASNRKGAKANTDDDDDDRLLIKHYDRRKDQVVPIENGYNNPATLAPNATVKPPNDQQNPVKKDDHNSDEIDRGVPKAVEKDQGNNPEDQELQPDDDNDRRGNRESNDDKEDSNDDDDEGDDDDENSGSYTENQTDEVSESGAGTSRKHPAKLLPPIDLLLLIDASSSVGNNNFEQMKHHLVEFIDGLDIAPNRTRISAIEFANEPTVAFDFGQFYTHRSVNAAIRKLPYLGGPTFLAKALLFATGVLYQEQNMKTGKHRRHNLMPTPRHDRLQVLLVVSDGYSEDNVAKVATILHDKMHVKVAALVQRIYNRERLMPLTRYDGAIFTHDQLEALNIWLWRQQKIWYEHYAGYLAKEKSLPLENGLKK